MALLINLGEQPSLVTQFVAELRDELIQQNRLRFRTNLQRIGSIMAYEMSKHLTYTARMVTTPMGEVEVPVLTQHPVLGSVLRAGLPMHEGFLQLYDQADNAFVSAYRKHTSGNKFVIHVEYVSSPTLEGRTLILTDPMIATGRSITEAYEALALHGSTPARLMVASVIASEEGLAHIQRHLPDADIWVCAVDDELTAKSYIVPGLGDAGDLAFGSKR